MTTRHIMPSSADVMATSRPPAATMAGAETAAMSTVLDFTPSPRPLDHHVPRRATSSPGSQMITTMTVIVDKHDVIELQTLTDGDDVSPASL